MPHPAIAILREKQGDVAATAEAMGVTPEAIYQAVRRAGLSITDLKYAHARPVTEDTVTMRRADYIAIVAQVNSTGTVWAEQERIIDTLTRLVSDLAARLAKYEGIPA